jgi:hypothetical protein
MYILHSCGLISSLSSHGWSNGLPCSLLKEIPFSKKTMKTYENPTNKEEKYRCDIYNMKPFRTMHGPKSTNSVTIHAIVSPVLNHGYGSKCFTLETWDGLRPCNTDHLSVGPLVYNFWATAACWESLLFDMNDMKHLQH